MKADTWSPPGGAKRAEVDSAITASGTPGAGTFNFEHHAQGVLISATGRLRGLPGYARNAGAVAWNMPSIGLFPLSIVLLPGERLPLHIFEQRYRDLIGDCLRDGTPFGIVLVSADGTKDIGTEAHVVEVLERFEDGRLNVMVEGGRRFQTLETDSSGSYLSAGIAAYDDTDELPDQTVFDTFTDEYHRVGESLGLELEMPEAGPWGLSYAIASMLVLSNDAKQELLESTSEADRLDKLSGLLPAAVVQARQVIVEHRATTNGHSKHTPELGPG